LLKAVSHQGKQKRTGEYAQLLKQAADKAESWNRVTAQHRERFLKAILDRVVILSDSIEVRISKDFLIQTLAGNAILETQGQRDLISLACPFQCSVRGKALRLIVGNDQAPPQASVQAMISAIARARAWRAQLICGEVEGIKHLAKLHQIGVRYVRKILPFGYLSPASIETILNGQVRPGLTLDSLASKIPTGWREQRALIGSV
jgi:site-specific DNA recombinase